MRRSFSGWCSLLLPKSRQTLRMSIPYLRLKNNAQLHCPTKIGSSNEDFLTGNGTALSPPLYLCIITLLLIILAFQPKLPGKIGVVGLTILGFIFLLGEFVETNTYRVLNPATFNMPVALDVLMEIFLALLMITFGIITIMHEKQAHQ